MLARRDIGGDLDRAPVEVEEAHAVAATGCVHRAGFADHRHARRDQPFGEGVHVGGGRGAEGEEVDAALVGVAQPYHVLLRRADRGEESDAGISRLRSQAPEILIERELFVVVGDGQIDVAKMGDQAVIAHTGTPCPDQAG
jgi:hypothetical protein